MEKKIKKFTYKWLPKQIQINCVGVVAESVHFFWFKFSKDLSEIKPKNNTTWKIYEGDWCGILQLVAIEHIILLYLRIVFTIGQQILLSASANFTIKGNFAYSVEGKFPCHIENFTYGSGKFTCSLVNFTLRKISWNVTLRIKFK